MLDILASMDYSLISEHSILVGSWDATTFLKNASNLDKTIGGAILGLLGVIALVVSVVFKNERWD